MLFNPTKPVVEIKVRARVNQQRERLELTGNILLPSQIPPYQWLLIKLHHVRLGICWVYDILDVL